MCNARRRDAPPPSEMRQCDDRPCGGRVEEVGRSYARRIVNVRSKASDVQREGFAWRSTVGGA
eukprot:8228367-Lingulodinium_polyedra.AAC.1